MVSFANSAVFCSQQIFAACDGLPVSLIMTQIVTELISDKYNRPVKAFKSGILRLVF